MDGAWLYLSNRTESDQYTISETFETLQNCFKNLRTALVKYF